MHLHNKVVFEIAFKGWSDYWLCGDVWNLQIGLLSQNMKLTILVKIDQNHFFQSSATFLLLNNSGTYYHGEILSRYTVCSHAKHLAVWGQTQKTKFFDKTRSKSVHSAAIWSILAIVWPSLLLLIIKSSSAGKYGGWRPSALGPHFRVTSQSTVFNWTHPSASPITATHQMLLNHGRLTTENSLTPQETWDGRAVSFRHIQTFMWRKGG